MSPRLRALVIIPFILWLVGLNASLQGWIDLSAFPFISNPATAPPTYGMVRRSIEPLVDQAPPLGEEASNPAAAVPDPALVDLETEQAAARLAVSTETPATAVSVVNPPVAATPLALAASPVESLAYQRQMAILEQLWQTVDQKYLYPNFNGLDWEATLASYQLRLQAGLTDEEFYQAMSEMVMSLGDDHSVFLNPEEVAKEDQRYSGKQNYVGVGFLLAPVAERNRATVLLTFPGSPAAEAGINPHDSILAADGEPILDETGRLRSIVRGPEGTSVVLTVQSPDEAEPRQLTLPRRKITGSIPVPSSVLVSPQGKRIGYIMLVTLADATVDDQVRQALEGMTSEKPLDGLIIDNRQNEGGADTVLRGILAYFTDGILGHFISRDSERPLEVAGENIGGSEALPLVVLVGPNTFSYGEVFSGVLQDLGRAYVIGEPSEGNVETLHGYNFSDGSRAWLAHDSFRPLNNPELDWEQSGIQPDLVVASSWDLYGLVNDPAVLASLAYFER